MLLGTPRAAPSPCAGCIYPAPELLHGHSVKESTWGCSVCPGAAWKLMVLQGTIVSSPHPVVSRPHWGLSPSGQSGAATSPSWWGPVTQCENRKSFGAGLGVTQESSHPAKATVSCTGGVGVERRETRGRKDLEVQQKASILQSSPTGMQQLWAEAPSHPHAPSPFGSTAPWQETAAGVKIPAAPRPVPGVRAALQPQRLFISSWGGFAFGKRPSSRSAVGPTATPLLQGSDHQNSELPL